MCEHTHLSYEGSMQALNHCRCNVARAQAANQCSALTVHKQTNLDGESQSCISALRVVVPNGFTTLTRGASGAKETAAS